jgi:hypothetical protein
VPDPSSAALPELISNKLIKPCYFKEPLPSTLITDLGMKSISWVLFAIFVGYKLKRFRT